MNIGIIGHFGGKEVFLDGQTVKTLNLEKMLKDGGYSILRVDTHLRRKHPLLLMFKTIGCLFRCKKIFILLSVNGMRFYLKFLYYANKLFRIKIYHDIIGSELLTMVKDDPKLVKYLNAIEVNWFEYDSGTEALRRAGVSNVLTLPNCKTLTPVDIALCNRQKEKDEPYTFCTFSRVMKEKGITEAAKAVSEVNREKGKKVATLDVYGQIDKSYEEEFKQVIGEYSDCVKYCGMVNSDESVKVLTKYYALLFPTSWNGEGFPGTILDAFASGLPIIASDWNANGDLIDAGVTGLLYPSDTMKTLTDAIRYAVNNEEAINAMRINCREQFDNYTPEKVFSAINAKLTEN